MKAKTSRDFDVRSAVVRHLLHHGVERARIRHEITLDTNSAGGRADVVVAHKDSLALACIEIKSGADKLGRLEDQIARYNRAFDFVTVMADARHHEAVCRLGYIGACIGFWCPDQGFVDLWRGTMESCVPHLFNRDCHRSGSTGVVNMASLLWASEARDVARSLGYATTTRRAAVDWLRENATLREARPLIIKELVTRQQNRSEESFWAAFDAAEKVIPGRAA